MENREEHVDVQKVETVEYFDSQKGTSFRQGIVYLSACERTRPSNHETESRMLEALAEYIGFG